MKSPKVRHATHHFQWQKNTICICGLRGFKKHYRENFWKDNMYIVITHIHIFVKSIDMFFFGTTVQTGYAFWAGLAKVFCSLDSCRVVSSAKPCARPLPLWSQDQCRPTLSRQQQIHRPNLPKDSFHCASPVTADYRVWTLTCLCGWECKHV